MIALGRGGRGVVAPLPLDEGLRVPCRRLQPARRALRGHEHLVVDRRSSMVIAGGLAGLAGAVRHPRRLAHGCRPASRPGWASTASPWRSSATRGRSAWSAAAFLFGALRAARRRCRPQTGTPLDLVVIIQALVILFIAAPGPRPRDLPDQGPSGRPAPRSSPRGGADDRARRPPPLTRSEQKVRHAPAGPGHRLPAGRRRPWSSPSALSVEPGPTARRSGSTPAPRRSRCRTSSSPSAMTVYLLAAAVAFAGGGPADAGLRRAMGTRPGPGRVRVRVRLPDVGRPPASR